jgi:hypothetical protein
MIWRYLQESGAIKSSFHHYSLKDGFVFIASVLGVVGKGEEITITMAYSRPIDNMWREQKL